MYRLAELLTQLSLLCAATAAVFPPRRSNAHSKVLYLMTNNDQANGIRALPIDSDGRLDHGYAYSTGGKGSRVVSAAIGDALASQSALHVTGDSLLAVNAGSNTLSMFAIDPKNPLKLTLVGKPIDTLGDFPNTVTTSDKIPGLACVANSGTKSGVACFKMGANGLSQTDGKLHALPLSPVQTNPPQGPFNTVSQIFFNTDATQLLATVKGDPTMNNTGYFGSFAVSNGILSNTLAHSSPNGTAVLFGSVPLADNKVFATDASFGAAVLQISSSGEATLLYKYSIPTNQATCWATVSPETGLVYVTDDGADTVVALDPLTASPKATTILQNHNGAMTEITPSGKMLYALSHGNTTQKAAIVVMGTEGSSGKVYQIQNFFPDQVNDNVEGLAIYPSEST